MRSDVRVLGSILMYWIQRLNRWTSDLSAKGANVECWCTNFWGGGGGGGGKGKGRGHAFPGIFKIGLSTMQFPAFPGPELVNRALKNAHEK